jgi:hypothetical protein
MGASWHAAKRRYARGHRGTRYQSYPHRRRIIGADADRGDARKGPEGARPSNETFPSAVPRIGQTQTATMAEPDDLYTLRAQFWLGHYDMVRSFGGGLICWLLGMALVSDGGEQTDTTHAGLVFWSRFQPCAGLVWPHALGLWVEGDAVLQKEMDGQ